MHPDYDSYEMNKLDHMRTKELRKQIKNKGYQFKFFVTNVNHYYCSYDLLEKQNREIRRTIRKFYKLNLKMIIFNERCMDGKYHRHILIEDATDLRWRYPSKRMNNFLDVDERVHCLAGSRISDLSKINLLDHVIRILPFISNGKKALDIRPIHNLDKLLAYCTKQFEIHQPSYKVIDSASSDIDLGFYLHNKQIGDQWHPRFYEYDRSYISMNPPPRPI